MTDFQIDAEMELHVTITDFFDLTADTLDEAKQKVREKMKQQTLPPGHPGDRSSGTVEIGEIRFEDIMRTYDTETEPLDDDIANDLKDENNGEDDED